MVSPDGSKIFVACKNDILVWNAETGENETCLSGHTDLVREIFRDYFQRIL